MGSNGVDQVQVCRKFKVQSLAISWLGEAWICPKQLKHYPAFLSNGKMIAVHSFVFILHEDEERRYLCYLQDLFEDEKEEKKAEVRWFCHNLEVKKVIPHLNAHPDEVLITPDVQVIDAEYIDQVGAVLIPVHYDQCWDLIPNNVPPGTFFCQRQFKSKEMRAFSLKKLRGYNNQPILSLLDNYCTFKKEQELQTLNVALLCEEPRKLRTRGLRNGRGLLKEDGRHSGTPDSVIKNERAKSEPQKLKISKQSGGIKLVGSEASRSSSEDEKNIELLCQGSGIRGCWFRCKILQTSQDRIKVEYCDVQYTGGPGKLEEWAPASRVAVPDKLNMRCAGRLTVRPWPPQTSVDCSFEIGDAVDAWWEDGWWECVVVGLDKSGRNNVQVYLPGENKFLSFQRKDLRASRDWINGEWIEIKGNPDIHSFIASTIASGIGRNAKVLRHSASTDVSKLAGDAVLKSSKPQELKVDTQNLPGSVRSTTDPKDRRLLNPKKRALLLC